MVVPAPAATSSTAQTSSSSADAGPSRTSAPLPASHEEAQSRYLALKSQLDGALTKKRSIDRTLSDLEAQIWLFEGSYFQSTAASGGNIVKGFDNYLKATQTTGRVAVAAQLAIENGEIPPEDRVFSASSLTYQRSLELKAAEEMAKQASANKEKTKASNGASKKEKHVKEKEKDKESGKDKEKEKEKKETKEKEKDKDKDKDKEKEKDKDKDKEKEDEDKAVATPSKEGAKEKKEKKRRREE
ncbi:unnamed protein product [Parajaminaea phylloscopi]